MLFLIESLLDRLKGITLMTEELAEELANSIIYQAIHPNLGNLSHSSCVLLHTCPRKYELYKMMKTPPRERDVHTDFGTLVGYGVQRLLVTGSLQQTYFDMFLSWDGDLFSAQGENRDKKNFWFALVAIDKFKIVCETLLAEYDIVRFEDEAATELGFSISLVAPFKYRGFVDCLLIHKRTRRFAVLETKTTKFSKVHEAQFRNSGQGLGYSIVTDVISSKLGLPVSDSFDILYLIYKTSSMEWEELPVSASHSERANWIRSLLIDVKHISEYVEEEYFPMRGESCYDYFKPCDYYEVCQMSNKYLIGKGPVEVKEKEGEGDVEKYQFHFTLEDMIEAQIEKHSLAWEEEK